MGNNRQKRGRNSADEAAAADEGELPWQDLDHDKEAACRGLLRFMMHLLDDNHQSLRGSYLTHNLDPKNKSVPGELKTNHTRVMNKVQEVQRRLRECGLHGGEPWNKQDVLELFFELGDILNDAALLPIRDMKGKEREDALEDLCRRLLLVTLKINNISESIEKQDD